MKGSLKAIAFFGLNGQKQPIRPAMQRERAVSVRSVAQDVARRIIVADYDDVVFASYFCTADSPGVFPDELCVVAAVMNVGLVDHPPMVRGLLSLPCYHRIGYPIISGGAHEEVFPVLLFPPA